MELPPEDMGPAPEQVAPVGDVCEASFETGGMLLPEITPDIQTEVRRLIDPARLQGEAGKKHVVFSWPSVGPNPVPEPRTRGFFRVAFPWLFPGGFGCFFDDRPFGDGLKFEKRPDHLIYYYDGRFASDVAVPFVALNMAYRRRSAEQSSWFLKSHVEDPPDERRGDAGQTPGGRPLLPRQAQTFWRWSSKRERRLLGR